MRRVKDWKLPTIEDLRYIFTYDAKAGFVFRKSNGDRLGKHSSGGYRVVYVFGKWVPEHRVIWALHHGEWPPLLIDHVNGLTWDNSIENLRLATPSENQANTKIRGDNSSGVRGVSGKGNVWVSYLNHGGIKVHYQVHSNMADAVIARRKAVKEHVGEFASRNEFSTSSIIMMKEAALLLARNGCRVDEIMRACDCHEFTAVEAIRRAEHEPAPAQHMVDHDQMPSILSGLPGRAYNASAQRGGT
jgi:hypothetical protein